MIGLLHSDDLFFSSDTISKIAEIFNKTDFDLIYGNGIFIDFNDKIKRIYSSSQFKSWYLKFGWIPLHTTIFVKKNIY